MRLGSWIRGYFDSHEFDGFFSKASVPRDHVLDEFLFAINDCLAPAIEVKTAVRCRPIQGEEDDWTSRNFDIFHLFFKGVCLVGLSK